MCDVFGVSCNWKSIYVTYSAISWCPSITMLDVSTITTRNFQALESLSFPRFLVPLAFDTVCFWQRCARIIRNVLLAITKSEYHLYTIERSKQSTPHTVSTIFHASTAILFRLTNKWYIPILRRMAMSLLNLQWPFLTLLHLWLKQTSQSDAIKLRTVMNYHNLPCYWQIALKIKTKYKQLHKIPETLCKEWSSSHSQPWL